MSQEQPWETDRTKRPIRCDAPENKEMAQAAHQDDLQVFRYQGLNLLDESTQPAHCQPLILPGDHCSTHLQSVCHTSEFSIQDPQHRSSQSRSSSYRTLELLHDSTSLHDVLWVDAKSGLNALTPSQRSCGQI